jgi:molybdenum cofactor guanylyltransferase
VDTALILAGGSSSRLGRPKPLEDVAGTPMIRRVFDALAPLAEDILVSVADLATADAIREKVPKVRFVVDRRKAVGPIEGLARGAEVARGERILVAPCDAPLLRTDLYRRLLDALGNHEAAVPRRDVIDPVRAVYRKAAVLRVLHGSRPIPSPSALVDQLDAAFVGEEDLRSIDPRLDSFLDVNTEADLEEALRRMRSPQS